MGSSVGDPEEVWSHSLTYVTMYTDLTQLICMAIIHVKPPPNDTEYAPCFFRNDNKALRLYKSQCNSSKDEKFNKSENKNRSGKIWSIWFKLFVYKTKLMRLTLVPNMFRQVEWRKLETQTLSTSGTEEGELVTDLLKLTFKQNV